MLPLRRLFIGPRGDVSTKNTVLMPPFLVVVERVSGVDVNND